MLFHAPMSVVFSRHPDTTAPGTSDGVYRDTDDSTLIFRGPSKAGTSPYTAANGAILSAVKLFEYLGGDHTKFVPTMFYAAPVSPSSSIQCAHGIIDSVVKNADGSITVKYTSDSSFSSWSTTGDWWWSFIPAVNSNIVTGRVLAGSNDYLAGRVLTTQATATGYDAELADASDIPTGSIAGVIERTTSGSSLRVVTSGPITLSDWSDSLGTPELTPGTIYYLHPTEAGKITGTEPEFPNAFVIGRAISPQTLIVSPGVPSSTPLPGKFCLRQTADMETSGAHVGTIQVYDSVGAKVFEIGAHTNSSQNISFGNYAGSQITTGSNNLLFGDAAGNSLATGNDNVFLGRAAGGLVTSGVRNVAIGASALNGGNPSDSIAIGRAALVQATGSTNLAIGYEAGKNVTTGYSNIFIGYRCGAGSQNGVHKNVILIGSGVISDFDDQIVFGNSSHKETKINGRVFLPNITAPTTSPVSGVFLFAEGGALKAKLPSGTVVTLAS